LDKVTATVRDFYEAYPYPPDGTIDCDGYHAALLSSYVERTGNGRHPLRVLEAGCGRALNLQAAARLQPKVEFTGIDINRVAIAEARQALADMGPDNLCCLPADLLEAASMPTVEGGYDLVLSYGVIHHLSDPAAGLQCLRERLAPDGVMALMLDGRYGRQPLDRYLEALAMLDTGRETSGSRMATARALARVAEHSLFNGNCWRGTAEVDDVEFADRCLHVHERSYDLDGLQRLIASAGLRFLRWMEPGDWSAAALSDDPDLRQRLSQLDVERQYRLIERLCYRPKLTLILTQQHARPRARLASAAIGEAVFRRNPQLKPIEIDAETVYRLRARRPVSPASACIGQILQLDVVRTGSFSAQEIADHPGLTGFDRDEVSQALFTLEADEWLYRPHAPRAGCAV
jgi:SAM-dependent methyltransferase